MTTRASYREPQPQLEISLLAVKCLLNEKKRHHEAISKGMREWNRAQRAALTTSKPPVGRAPSHRLTVRR